MYNGYIYEIRASLAGMHLISVYLTGVPLMGVHRIGVPSQAVSHGHRREERRDLGLMRHP